MTNFTDDQLLDGIKAGDRLTLKHIYQQFLPMARHITGNQSDGEIVFSEVLESIWRRLQTEKMELSCKFSTYLYGSLWRAWAKKQRKPMNFQHQVPIEHLDAAKYAEQMDDDFERADRARLVAENLAKLGETCQKLLQMAFMEERSNEEILTEMQFSSDGFLRKKKTECKTKLIELCRADARFIHLTSLAA
jgi:RNA polymerase sigma factor (sigma-70 family)